MRRFYTLGLIFLFMGLSTNAQFAYKEKADEDSIYFSKPYPYVLPILGQKAHDAKARMPLPFGIMVNALTGNQKLQLDDMTVGFGRYSTGVNPRMIDVSDIVVFDQTNVQTSTFNLRLDAWLLPFLDVYGIVGQTKKANIDISLQKPFPLQINTDIVGTYVGYGLMLAGKVGPLFLSLDANETFSYNPRLDKPAKVSLSGFRTGPIFQFKNKPEMNVTLWLGAMYSFFHADTEGKIGALELAPDAQEHIAGMQNDLDTWYGDLSMIDKAKYALPYRLLSEGLDNIYNNVDDGYISYYFNKTINDPWNMLVGAQWQVNYRWQLRAEAQLFGDRTAGLFSLNYRFGIKGKNWFSK